MARPKGRLTKKRLQELRDQRAADHERFTLFDNPRAAAKPLTRDEALPTAVVRRRIKRLLGVSLALRDDDRLGMGGRCLLLPC